MDGIDPVKLNLISKEVCFVCLFTCGAEITQEEEKGKKGK